MLTVTRYNTNVSNVTGNYKNTNQSTNANILYLSQSLPINVGFQGRKTPSQKVVNIETSIINIFKESLAKIKENTLGLSWKERQQINKKLEKIEKKIGELSNIKLQLGRLLDYDNLKKGGVSSQLISKFVNEDDKTIENAVAYSNRHATLKDYMFGYPANMEDDTAVIQKLRQLEAKLPLINECGDSYEIGNYSMDAKREYEQPILEKIYKHLGLPSPETVITEQVEADGTIKKGVDFRGPWGYISPGGSESNKWGISNGLRKYPNATVYYSKAAHYSVPKAVKMHAGSGDNAKTLNYVKSEAISTKSDSEQIDSDELISKIKMNWDLNKEPAVILLTWGTTKTGAIDDVAEISRRLKKLKIDHYIHLDVAMYGGIAKNQKDAPTLPNMKELGIDSVSISLHKYFGSNGVNSIVVAKNKPYGEHVDYIGITDSTTSGSRTFSPFSTLQRVIETLERKQPDDYSKNVIFFDNLLRNHNIPFSRENNANTFIIDKPSNFICKKYQLSVFKDNDGKEKAHVIIFPHHKKNIMQEFIKDLMENK